MVEIKKHFIEENHQADRVFDCNVIIEEIIRSITTITSVIAFLKDFVSDNEGKQVVSSTFLNRISGI